MLWSWIKIIHVTPAPDIAVNYPTVGHQCCGNEGSLVELETNLREVWNIITEKASTKGLLLVESGNNCFHIQDIIKTLC